jgi:hypothetical protein
MLYGRQVPQEEWLLQATSRLLALCFLYEPWNLIDI